MKIFDGWQTNGILIAMIGVISCAFLTWPGNVAAITFQLAASEPSDAELARVFGEGIPGTKCINQTACLVPNTCANAPGGGCTGSGGCSGPKNRICVFDSYTICVQTPIQTCCVPQGCVKAKGLNGVGQCVPNGVQAGAVTGSRSNC